MTKLAKVIQEDKDRDTPGPDQTTYASEDAINADTNIVREK
jgi:hypothetical protein